MELLRLAVGKQQFEDDWTASGSVDCELCSLQRAASRSASLVPGNDFASIEEGPLLTKDLSEDRLAYKTPVWLRRSLGSLLGLMAGLFLTVGSLLSGSVRTMSVMQTCSARSFFAAVFLVPPLIIFKPSFNVDGKTHLELVALSAVFASKFLAFSWGSAHLPIAEFSVLANTVPIYTAVLGCVLLRERCVKKALACALVTIGVITVILSACFEQDNEDDDVGTTNMSGRVGGYASTLLSAVANAGALLWLRRLGSVSALWVSLYASVASALLAGATAGVVDSLSLPSGRDISLAAAAGVCTLMQSYLPALACVLTDPSRVAISMTLAVAFSFVLQATVQRRQPSAFTCIGGLVIVAAIVGCHVHWDQFFGRTQQEDDGSTDDKKQLEKQPLLPATAEVDHASFPMRYGAVALIGSPESCRLCSACRLAT